MIFFHNFYIKGEIFIWFSKLYFVFIFLLYRVKIIFLCELKIFNIEKMIELIIWTSIFFITKSYFTDGKKMSATIKKEQFESVNSMEHWVNFLRVVLFFITCHFPGKWHLTFSWHYHANKVKIETTNKPQHEK